MKRRPGAERAGQSINYKDKLRAKILQLLFQQNDFYVSTTFLSSEELERRMCLDNRDGGDHHFPRTAITGLLRGLLRTHDEFMEFLDN